MGEFVTEVPSSLKQLARLVVRGFYLIEDSLIIDMLVRNPCMKEDDICDLLKFERKMLRGRIDTLKNDKFIQTKMKMETGPDGKAQRQNYYYINYKVFVNVVKYKLDHMRRKMETEERNATSRASFKCPSCDKTYTDLQADQLFDPVSGEFLCTFCGAAVEEDAAALPRQDSRMMLARFNEVMEPLFVLLKEVEGIKLAPELLEPEPLDIQDILHRDDRKRGRRDGVGVWSGEATRTSQQTETTVTVLNSDEESAANQAVQRKERPVWMVESTVVTDAAPSSSAVSSAALLLPSGDGVSSGGAAPSPLLSGGISSQADDSQMSRDDIMSVLLQHEKRAGESRRAPAAALKNGAADSSSDDSDGQLARRGNRRARPDSPVSPQRQAASSLLAQHTVGSPSADADVEMMDSDEDESVPTVQVGSERVPISEVTGDVIARMTSDEKEAYIVTYQECYGDMHE